MSSASRQAPELGELAGDRAEPRVERGLEERGFAARLREDQAAGDRGRHAHEAARRRIDPGEAVLVRDLQEAPVGGVAPAVVGADERVAVAARRRLDARAAVAAHVEERADLAGRAAREEQRHAGRVVREEVAGRGELRRVADDQRQPAEHARQLAGVALLVEIRRHRHRRRRSRGVGRPLLEVSEHAADQRRVEIWQHAMFYRGSFRASAAGRTGVRERSRRAHR